MNTVICQEWIESERGWGIRPDGASFHLSEADLQAYIKEYWDMMPESAPEEYSKPSSKNVIVVNDTLYQRIKKSTNGIRMWESDYRQLDKSEEKALNMEEKTSDRIIALKKELAELEAKNLEERKASVWKKVEGLNNDDLLLLGQMIKQNVVLDCDSE